MKTALSTLLLLLCNFTSIHALPPTETKTLKQQVSEILPYFEGWCSPEKADHFIDLVLEVEPKLCVEIGVFGGASSYPVAAALKSLGTGIVIGIDPWNRFECIKGCDPEDFSEHIRWWKQLDLQSIHNSYSYMIAYAGVEKHCEIINSTAQKAAPLFDSEAIDILHIDGNISPAGCALDATLYLPKVRSGGYIWVNDTGQRQRAIAILLTECKIIKLIDNGNCLLLQKN